MFAVKVSYLFDTTFGEFAEEIKAHRFGFAEFGDLCEWEVVAL